VKGSLHKTKLLFAFGVVIAVVSLGVINFTDACRLEEVTFNNKPVNDWPIRYDMLRKKSLFRQPLDSLGQVVLSKKGTFKVDISCSWPHTLNIRTNAFSPTCFLLDKGSGQLCGLVGNGRITPLRNAVTDWERPVLTGVKSGRLLGYCRDARVKVVVDQLELLRKNNLNLFRLIDEIDFETADYVQVSISGLPYRLKVRPGELSEDLGRFIEFITRYDPDLSGIRQIDLRYDNMIVCARGKN